MSHEHIDEIEFTIFDTETTGLDPVSGDRIIEIAGMRVKGERILATYETLINPQRPVSQGAFNVHGISDEQLLDAPLARDILPVFLEFSRGSVLCSYNAPFDLGFVNAELARAGFSSLEDTAAIDILRMARRLLPEIERHALWFVAYTLGIKQDQLHRALCDVELTWQVFRKLSALLKDKGISDMKKVVSLFGVTTAHTDEERERICAQIQEAITMGAKVRIEYLSASGVEVTHREVVPKEIRQDGKRWYLTGYCCLRNEERTFRVDGILHMEIV